MKFVALFFGTIDDLILTYERVQQHAIFFVCYHFADLFALLSLNVLFIAYLGMGIWGFVLSKVIVMTVGATYLLGRNIPKVGLKVDFTIARKMAIFGAPLILAGLAFFIIHSSDRFFLNEYASLHDVGIYSLAYKFAVLLSVLVAEPFGRVWDVSLYTYAKEEDWEHRFSRILAYLVFALVLVGLGISVFIDETLAIMADPRFFGAAAVVPILVLAYLMRECADFLRNMLYINKRSALVSRLAIYCAIANIILNFALIKPFGMYGAAISTLFTWLIYFLLCWRAEHLEFGVKLPFFSIGCLVVFAGAVYFGTTLFASGNWFIQVALDSVWIIGFLILVMLSGYFTVEEKSTMKAQFLSLFGAGEEKGEQAGKSILAHYITPLDSNVKAAGNCTLDRQLVADMNF